MPANMSSPSSIPLGGSEVPQSLNDLEVGDRAIIHHLNGLSVKVRQRLLEMGLTHGTRIHVIRFAPLRDPIEIAIRGYRLSLRREEASSIIVDIIAA